MWTPRIAVLLLALISMGCNKSEAPDAAPEVHEPHVQGKMLPTGLESLALGTSTMAEAQTLLGAPTSEIADKSLGGDQVASYNNTPIARLTWRSKASLLAEAKRDGVDEKYAQLRVTNAPGLLPEAGSLASFGEVELVFAKLDGDEPVLISIHVAGLDANLCAFARETVGADEQATKCPGTNRVFGEEKGGVAYCAGDAEGTRNVFVDCRPERAGEVLEYTLAIGQ